MNYYRLLFVALLFLIALGVFLILKDDKKNEVVVAILDTGIEKKGFDERIKVLKGYDFIDNDRTPDDPHGHGTHVAKIITDISPESSLIPLKILDKNGKGQNQAWKAIIYAILYDADIVNMSYSNNYSWKERMAIWIGKQKGVVFIGAKGDNKKGVIDYPAKYESVLSVGTFGKENNAKETADFYTNRIESVNHKDETPFKRISGSSVSTAQLTGLVALLKESGMGNEEIIPYIKSFSIKKDNRYLVHLEAVEKSVEEGHFVLLTQSKDEKKPIYTDNDQFKLGFMSHRNKHLSYQINGDKRIVLKPKNGFNESTIDLKSEVNALKMTYGKGKEKKLLIIKDDKKPKIKKVDHYRGIDNHRYVDLYFQESFFDYAKIDDEHYRNYKKITNRIKKITIPRIDEYDNLEIVVVDKAKNETKIHIVE